MTLALSGDVRSRLDLTASAIASLEKFSGRDSIDVSVDSVRIAWNITVCIEVTNVKVNCVKVKYLCYVTPL